MIHSDLNSPSGEQTAPSLASSTFYLHQWCGLSAQLQKRKEAASCHCGFQHGFLHCDPGSRFLTQDPCQDMWQLLLLDKMESEDNQCLFGMRQKALHLGIFTVSFSISPWLTPWNTAIPQCSRALVGHGQKKTNNSSSCMVFCFLEEWKNPMQRSLAGDAVSRKLLKRDFNWALPAVTFSSVHTI